MQRGLRLAVWPSSYIDIWPSPCNDSVVMMKNGASGDSKILIFSIVINAVIQDLGSSQYPVAGEK